MNNTESKEPLYKQLNKERTQGVWDIIGDDKTILSVPDGKMTICSMNHTHPVKEWNRGVKAAQANAKYVSLAVNNLSSLAEALEELISECNFIPKEVFTEAGKDSFQDSLNKAKEALLKIS